MVLFDFGVNLSGLSLEFVASFSSGDGSGFFPLLDLGVVGLCIKLFPAAAAEILAETLDLLGDFALNFGRLDLAMGVLLGLELEFKSLVMAFASGLALGEFSATCL